MKAYSCLTAVALVGLLSALAVGCAAPGDEAANTTEDALTSGLPATGLCSDPVPSADGQWLLLDFCPTTTDPGRVVVRKLNSVTAVEIASYSNPSKIIEVVQSGDGYAVALTRPDGHYDVLAGSWTNANATARVDVSSIAGAAAEAPDALHVTADGKWALGLSGSTGVFFATEIATGVTTSKDIGAGGRTHRFLSKGNRALLISTRAEQTAVGRPITLSGVPAVGSAVDLQAQEYDVADETYDGQTILAETKDLKRIDLHTGVAQSLTGGVEVKRDFGADQFGAGYAWFTKTERIYDEPTDTWNVLYTLQRVRTDGTGSIEVYRSALNRSLSFIGATGDEAHVIYAERESAEGPLAIKHAGLDPAASEGEVITRGDYPLHKARIGKRLAFSHESAATDRDTAFVLDADGTTVGELPGLDLGDSGYRDGSLSADGRVFYEGRGVEFSCHQSGRDFQSCESSGAYTLSRPIPIPGSSAVIVQRGRTVDGVAVRDMKVFSP